MSVFPFNSQRFALTSDVTACSTNQQPASSLETLQNLVICPHTIRTMMILDQIFHYARCITPKRVSSVRYAFSRHSAKATQLLV